MKKATFAIAVLISAMATPLVTATTWYVDCSVLVPGDGQSWESAFQTIQKGIDAASEGETVIVARGTYVENIHFREINIILRSTDPLDADVVRNTIVDGDQAGSVVTFSGTEGVSCVLSGFTIRNGQADQGGGIRGRSTRAQITYNVISGNSAGEDGGGMHRCDGTIRNNTISGNSAADDAGALHNCDGTIEFNTISGNSAEDDGGGLHMCDGVINNNSIFGNSAGHSGGAFSRCDARIQGNTVSGNWAGSAGGLHECNGIVTQNTVSRNWASDAGGGLKDCRGIIEANHITENVADAGGGLYSCGGIIRSNLIAGNLATLCGAGIAWCHGPIQNNVVAANRSDGDAGGLMGCGGTVQNNTIAVNRAEVEGGGLDVCTGQIVNCIIWGNSAQQDAQLSRSSQPTYSCIQDWADGGEGNIADDPVFFDADSGDFRLRSTSPCIDAGHDGTPDLPETDILGNPRIVYGGKSLTVDIGAYEYYVSQIVVNADGHISLTWSSLPGKTYSVYYSGDMLMWELAADNVPSMGDTLTIWVDPTSPIISPDVPRRYYKVSENP